MSRPHSVWPGGVLSGCVVVAALVSLAASSPQEPAPVEQIVIGGVTPRFAVPECVPHTADPASQAACRTITQVLRADLRFEGLFQFVPESLMNAIPPLDPLAPRFDDWKGIGAKILVATQAQIVSNELQVEVRVYFVDSGQPMLQRRYSGKTDNPRSFAHQASPRRITSRSHL